MKHELFVVEEENEMHVSENKATRKVSGNKLYLG
jgi:hypothetical protein